MIKRFVNGTILRVEDYITSVNFDCHNMDENYPSVRTYRYLDENIIDVKYNEGATISNLPPIMFERVAEEDIELTHVGKVIPRPTVIINGIEYIFSTTDYESISIYLLHNLPDLGVTESRCGVYNNNLYFAILDTDYTTWSIDDYVSFINESGLVFCHIIDDSKFNISNVYSLNFDNKIYEYKDFGIMGLQREFYVNDVTVTADFVRQMRERYPEIQFYARTEDRNATKYNEWINYKISPSPIKHGTLFTSHVRFFPTRGRFWKDALDIEFEYTTNDLPTLLTRRDQFRVGNFLNRDRVFSYIIDDGTGNKNFDVKYTVFWERDNLETEYGKTTNQDDNGYSQFSYKYTGRLGYINIEDSYTVKNINFVESVIYTVLYAPRNVDLNKYDDYVYLKDTDLDYKTFLKAFYGMVTDIEGRFGIKIEYHPTSIDIDTQSDITKNPWYIQVNNDLSNLLLTIKSIKDSATKQSNFVMIASLKQVQNLIENYKNSIMSKLEVADYDIEIEEGEIIGDDEYEMSFTENLLNTDIEDPQIENEEEKKEEEEKEVEDDEDVEIEHHHHDEHKINTDGKYEPSDEIENTNDGLIL